MVHWLDEYPALRVMQKSIAAEDYNRIRVGMLREHLPWRITLTQLRCLHCVLDDTAWVCIDESCNDLPILAWTKFRTAQRSALDSPIACELRLYHIHAGLLMGEALEALARAVSEHGNRQAHAQYPLSVLTHRSTE